MNAKNTIVAGMCVLFLLAGSVSAAPIWSDDFESGMAKWANIYQGGTGVAGIVADPAGGTNNVLHVKSADASANVGVVRSTAFSEAFDSTSVFHVEFDVYFPAVTKMSNFNLFSGENGGISGNGPTLIFRWPEEHTTSSAFDYTFDYHDDVNYHEVADSNIVTTTWTKVYLDASGDGNYDVYVGGHEAGDKVGTWALNTGSWDQIYMGYNEGEMYIDNILVTPEPATMVLLGLGGVGMLIRRRRRA